MKCLRTYFLRFLVFISILGFGVSSFSGNANALGSCTSGSTLASNGLSISLYGASSPTVLTSTWWSSWVIQNIRTQIQTVTFNMSGSQTGYYTMTWSEMVDNPQGADGLVGSIAGSNGITVLDVDVASVETDGNLYYSYFVTFYKNTANSQFAFSHPVNLPSSAKLTITAPIATLYHCYDETPYAQALTDIKGKIDVTNTHLNNLYNVMLYISDHRLADIQTALNNMKTETQQQTDIMEQQQQQDQEDRDNIEQQSSDAQDGADDSQQAAESTGSTLLAAFTAFVGALVNASPSNCNIDMDLGNVDLGVVNLCQLSPPAGFQAIASIFLILFCVPLSLATARKVISLFRSFQT